MHPQNRRSNYNLSAESTVSDAELQSILEHAVKHSPTAYNSQTSRVVLTLGTKHQELWSQVLDAYIPAIGDDSGSQQGFRLNTGAEGKSRTSEADGGAFQDGVSQRLWICSFLRRSSSPARSSWESAQQRRGEAVRQMVGLTRTAFPNMGP